MAAIAELLMRRYRAFRDEQRVRLGRLTLVYGENGAGKSALVRLSPWLSQSRTPGRPGLDLASELVGGASYRDVAWRGVSDDGDPDMCVGATIGSTAWRWQFEWRDEWVEAVLSHLYVGEAEALTWQKRKEDKGAIARLYRVNGAETPQQVPLDGVVPRGGIDPKLAEELGASLDRVVWVSSNRRGPGRAGLARGARGTWAGDGQASEAVALGDSELLERVSTWFAAHTGFQVVNAGLGGELQRLVLRPVRFAGPDMPFPDTGEGLQQVFPLIVALEQLRGRGGLLVVEEPESHLHGRLQRALIEHVVDVLAANAQAQVMLETHSEILLLGALKAAADRLRGGLCLQWVEVADGVGRVEEIQLDDKCRPQGPRFEQTFETMTSMRRELLELRRNLREG